MENRENSEDEMKRKQSTIFHKYFTSPFFVVFSCKYIPYICDSDFISYFKTKRLPYCLAFTFGWNLYRHYVERVIKTIKSKMHRYFTHAQSYKYIGELQKFAGSYNKTYHRTICRILSYPLNLHPIGRLCQSQQLCFFWLVFS
jgi:hypothetical protein